MLYVLPMFVKISMLCACFGTADRANLRLNCHLSGVISRQSLKLKLKPFRNEQ